MITLRSALAIVLLCLPAVADDTVNLRVLTYNIHHGEGTDGVIDLERIAAIIRECDPDVICLQEVDRNLPRTDHRDMPALFAELLGMAVIFEANYRFDGGEYGNATLTRLPIIGHENLKLPGPDGVEPRGCLRVDIEIKGRSIAIFNTHWGLKPDERLRQAEATMQFIEGHEFAILAGDLNAVPGSAPLEIVLQKLHDSIKPVDAGPEATAFNTVRNRRIDYVLATPQWKPQHASVIRNTATETASDHLPHVVELVVTIEDE